MRYALFAIAALLGAIVIGGLLLDEGEVVTLVSRGDEGVAYETQLWVVELHGQTLLRAHSSEADWLRRIREHPEVELRRAEQQRAYRAAPVPDVALRSRVNRAMAEKYGLSDRLLGLVWNFDRAVIVHLQPVSG